ncbi:MAG: M15 family metallopeptidase [Rikenellaceae bacterium]|nr:M15 family metallopeptidase [Rikenellaceae bacterium]
MKPIRLAPLLLALLLLPLRILGQTEGEALERWIAASCVSAHSVEEFGEQRCFAAEEIDAALRSRIAGKSYKAGCTVPLSELRYLKVLHYDLQGRIRLGELICNRAIAGELLDIFRTLYRARYPIERMVLVDDYDADDLRSMEADNTSCFNFRRIEGSTSLSKHSLGMAIDINPLYNPCVKKRGDRVTVSPESGRPYADRSADFPCKITADDLCYREFIRHGFTWGGAWNSLKDYQHFEK